MIVSRCPAASEISVVDDILCPEEYLNASDEVKTLAPLDLKKKPILVILLILGKVEAFRGRKMPMQCAKHKLNLHFAPELFFIEMSQCVWRCMSAGNFEFLHPL